MKTNLTCRNCCWNCCCNCWCNCWCSCCWTCWCDCCYWPPRRGKRARGSRIYVLVLDIFCQLLGNIYVCLLEGFCPRAQMSGAQLSPKKIVESWALELNCPRPNCEREGTQLSGDQFPKNHSDGSDYSVGSGNSDESGQWFCDFVDFDESVDSSNIVFDLKKMIADLSSF